MRQYKHQHPLEAPDLPNRSSSAGHCTEVTGSTAKSILDTMPPSLGLIVAGRLPRHCPWPWCCRAGGTPNKRLVVRALRFLLLPTADHPLRRASTSGEGTPNRRKMADARILIAPVRRRL